MDEALVDVAIAVEAVFGCWKFEMIIKGFVVNLKTLLETFRSRHSRFAVSA